MPNLYTLTLLVILLSSCGTTVKYIGQTSKATNTTIDVFVDPGAITRSYTIIGKGYAESYRRINQEQMQRKAMTIAKEKGADAILFEDYFVVSSGSSLTTSIKTDSLKNIRSLSSTSPVVTSGHQILFLKYK